MLLTKDDTAPLLALLVRSVVQSNAVDMAYTSYIDTCSANLLRWRCTDFKFILETQRMDV